MVSIIGSGTYRAAPTYTPPVENFQTSLVVGPLSSWPDEWLARAARLVRIALNQARADGAAPGEVASLEAELANYVLEQHRRELSN